MTIFVAAILFAIDIAIALGFAALFGLNPVAIVAGTALWATCVSAARTAHDEVKSR